MEICMSRDLSFWKMKGIQNKNYRIRIRLCIKYGITY